MSLLLMVVASVLVVINSKDKYLASVVLLLLIMSGWAQGKRWEALKSLADKSGYEWSAPDLQWQPKEPK